MTVLCLFPLQSCRTMASPCDTPKGITHASSGVTPTCLMPKQSFVMTLSLNKLFACCQVGRHPKCFHVLNEMAKTCTHMSTKSIADLSSIPHRKYNNQLLIVLLCIIERKHALCLSQFCFNMFTSTQDWAFFYLICKFCQQNCISSTTSNICIEICP